MQTHILGFPSIGSRRELKFALENFWAGKATLSDLEKTAENLKLESFRTQSDAGLSYVTAGDFSLYDRMLDTMFMLGLVPRRYTFGDMTKAEMYFAMARGDALRNLAALPMKKWFNTNYHYIVPEPDITFRQEPDFSKLTSDVSLAVEHGYAPKAVLIGPATFLALSNPVWIKNRWELMDELAEIYCAAIKQLPAECKFIQIDEPILCTELEKEAWLSFIPTHRKIKDAASDRKLMLTTYFGDPLLNMTPIYESGYDVIHLDITCIRHDMKDIISELPAHMSVSAGVVNGRNIWKTDTGRAKGLLDMLERRLGGERVMCASSCSLLHCPVDIRNENRLEGTLKNSMAFAVQKCRETAALPSHMAGASGTAVQYTAAKTEIATDRSPYSVRRKIQEETLCLPPLPTTTIGSFPQTQHIRSLRSRFKSGEISGETYESGIKKEIYDNIQRQIKLGLDVLVHGEPERNDMAEYFGENLEGFCFLENGWVQSYGSRCVKPPVIHGDVRRVKPITLKWIKYAASLTEKPVKAILTGPVTIAKWSFMREDIPQEAVWEQIALALRGEALELEQAGIPIIQIDEPAFVEAMPLGIEMHEHYFNDAVRCFRLVTSVLKDSTQVHTHMCYSEFDRIMPHIKRLDADVISIEAGRSEMGVLESFRRSGYKSGIGAGLYDIHSSRIPTATELSGKIDRILKYIPAEQVWINPDCGLKTRGWGETLSALQNMVTAAVLMRGRLKKKNEKAIG
ncbi:5-methyltetrahydropteroyltriglutamate--homocysteine S-methyltransferase [Seleniivibrio woodruffii]|uniref:5-methyltetrahydropteroyltriglutamate-- homocysteine S-methyltransferase n=1 Tax=Seleniivibrio woodruffii TaxID=1078050 RepID=UPI0026EB83A2|nr:5-methyltetrahydropteroyltriglutamate--homocysteine S-methyltransferase [Seleniivibrio woodruffii]